MIVGPPHLGGLFSSRRHLCESWSDFKHYRFKVVFCHFAYTTYTKALMEIRTFTCADEFQKKMATVDEIVVDLTPPLPPNCIQKYQQLHQTVVDRAYKNDALTNPTVTLAVKRKRKPPKRRLRQTGKGSISTALKVAQAAAKKFIPSTKHVFKRFWSGDILKNGLVGHQEKTLDASQKRHHHAISEKC